MKRISHALSISVSLSCLALSGLLPGACASEQNTLGPADGGVQSSGGHSGSPTTSAGKTNGVGGNAGASSAGKSNAGGGTKAEAGQPSAAGAPSAGTAAVGDKCQVSTDCTQVVGSCFVCEAVSGAKDCVDHGAPVCDNGKVDPCEACEVGQTKACTALGTPGDFSGGSATCKATCDGWDTSACSVCGNQLLEPGEECDGADMGEGGVGGATSGGGGGDSAGGGGGDSAGGAASSGHTCSDEGIAENASKPTPCTDTCHFDTTVCGGCSKGLGVDQCLAGADCAAGDCNGVECKLGTSCNIDCSGGGKSCAGVQCNHDASCTIKCNTSGSCAGVVCDSGSSCSHDC